MDTDEEKETDNSQSGCCTEGRVRILQDGVWNLLNCLTGTQSRSLLEAIFFAKTSSSLAGVTMYEFMDINRYASPIAHDYEVASVQDFASHRNCSFVYDFEYLWDTWSWTTRF